jgi:hypothetical protein
MWKVVAIVTRPLRRVETVRHFAASSSVCPPTFQAVHFFQTQLARLWQPAWIAIAACLLAVLTACASPKPAKVVVRISSPPAQALATSTASPAMGGPPTATPAPKCGLTELPPGQTISSGCSYTQTETQAAGPMLCRIERNSCAYKNMIVNRDPNIVFSQHKPPPLTDEDAMMHPAMLLPLTRLSDLVNAEWGGEVKLVVTAAYDSILEHDLMQNDPERKYSLHFEGRSIDLVPYPSDDAKMARLCALALTAGFDWIHNEVNHCHASINATSLCSVCSGTAP